MPCCDCALTWCACAAAAPRLAAEVATALRTAKATLAADRGHVLVVDSLTERIINSAMGISTVYDLGFMCE